MIYTYRIKKTGVINGIRFFEVRKGFYKVSMKKEASDMMNEIFYNETLDEVYNLFNSWIQNGLVFEYTLKF